MEHEIEVIETGNLQADCFLYSISQLHERFQHSFVLKWLPAGDRAIQQYPHVVGLVARVDEKLVCWGSALFQLVHDGAHLIQLELQRFQEGVGF